MNTGEDTQGLRKIVDFTRLISIFILAIHFYITCNHAFEAWHWTAGITDRIISNIAKTGFFNGLVKPKLASLLCLAISLVGIKGRKDEKIGYKSIIAYILSGLLLYWLSVLFFYMPARITVILLYRLNWCWVFTHAKRRRVVITLAQRQIEQGCIQH